LLFDEQKQNEFFTKVSALFNEPLESLTHETKIMVRYDFELEAIW